MAILEFLKKNAQAQIAGNAGAGQSSEYVTADVLAQILYEMYGSSQSGLTLPAGALGSFFPGGETLTGTNMMARTVDAVSLSSGAGATVNLKSFVVPAAVPQILGLGTTAVPGVRGIWFYASGSCPNTANAKSITVAFGGSAAQTATLVTTTVAALWTVYGTVLTRSNTSVVLNAIGSSATSAGASTNVGAVDLAVTGLTLTAAQTLQFACTQTSAGDVVQDTLIVGYIP